jgi:peptidyl-tRNA hydrolase
MTWSFWRMRSGAGRPERRETVKKHVFPGFKTVEITGIEDSGDDMLEYLPDIADEDLRLVWKCPPPTPRTAGD